MRKIKERYEHMKEDYFKIPNTELRPKTTRRKNSLNLIESGKDR
jgi:hypothetical protein